MINIVYILYLSGHAGELLSPGLQPELLKHNVRYLKIKTRMIFSDGNKIFGISAFQIDFH